MIFQAKTKAEVFVLAWNVSYLISAFQQLLCPKRFQKLGPSFLQLYSKSKMGLFSFLNDSILRMDLLSTSPSFRVRKQPNYQTIFGGIFSFLMMGGFAYVLYLQLIEMFSYEQITYSQGLSDDINSDTTITDLRMAVSIDGVDLTANTKKFIYTLYQNSIVTVNGVPTQVKTNIALSPCQLSDWQNVGNNFASQFTAFGFDKMLCISSSESYSLSGYVGSPNYNYLTFQVVQCNQALDASCDSQSNINTYMTNYLSTNDYFNVRFFLVDTLLTPQEDVAINYIIEKNIFMAFTSTIGTVGYISMAQYTLDTDNNPWPIVSTNQVTGSYIEGFQTNSVSISSTKYVSINIYKSTKSTTISRTIGKIDTVLSYVGGLFSLIFTGIAFFIGSYSEMKYQLYVAESMLKVDEKGKRIGESDFGFMTYLAYCCYDWLDTFGLAPKCMSRLSTIHQVREEACQQLDPTIILKRIKYLEEMSKVLLTEHRELSLYLSQPFTLQQARRMRSTLTFYDRALAEVVESSPSENSVRDQKYCNPPSNINAVSNSDCIQECKELTVQQEEEVLNGLMIEAVSQIERDNTDIGKRIKGRLNTRVKDLLKEMGNKKSVGTVEMEEVLSPMSPFNENENNSAINLKRGGKMIIKRQNR